MKTSEELARQIVDACAACNIDLLEPGQCLAWPTRDITNLIRARDRAVRAALLEELLTEIDTLGSPLREASWNPSSMSDELRRRAAAERGDDHA